MNGGGIPCSYTRSVLILANRLSPGWAQLARRGCGAQEVSRKQLLHFTANLQVKLIGMEACGGSHFLGRALREQGHEVRLMPAQYVKPYVKTNKSDYI